MLLGKYSARISNSVLPMELIRPFPAADIREKWTGIDKKTEASVVLRAEAYKETRLQPLKATTIMEAFSTGNTSQLLDILNRKLNTLTALTLGECLIDKDTYIEKILDTAWSIMDMSVWSTQIIKDKYNEKSYDTTVPILDHSAAQAGGTLTYAYYLLRKKIDGIDVNIGKRFEFEIKRKILEPFLRRKSNWMRGEGNAYFHSMPDDLSQIVLAAMIFEKNYRIKHRIVKESMEIIDEFLDNSQKKCPARNSEQAYYGLIRYLDVLYMATGSSFDVFNDEEILDYGKSVPIESCGFALLLHAYHSDNSELIERAYKNCNGQFYMNSLGKDLSMDYSLFLLFNSNLIANGFYKTIEFSAEGARHADR